MINKKKCHICLEDMIYIPNKNNKKCCEAFICNKCLSDCNHNNINNCPICRKSLNLSIDFSLEHNSFSETVIDNNIIIAIIILLFIIVIFYIVTILFIFVSLLEEDEQYNIFDFILYVIIITSIGMYSCLFGLIATLIYQRNKTKNPNITSSEDLVDDSRSTDYSLSNII